MMKPPSVLLDGIGAGIDAINALFYAEGKIITIHPWTQGIGETGTGKYSQQSRGYLSTGKALEHLANKLVDQNDPGKDGALDLIAVVIPGVELNSWILTLSLFNWAFALGDLPFCERRAKQLAALNQEKFTRKQPPLNPIWADTKVNRSPTAAGLQEVFQQFNAIAEAAMDSDPIAELQGEIDRRQERQQKMITSKAELLSILTAGNYLAFECTGFNAATLAMNVRARATLISNINAESYCAVVAIIAPDPLALNFYREVLL